MFRTASQSRDSSSGNYALNASGPINGDPTSIKCNSEMPLSTHPNFPPFPQSSPLPLPKR
jgi:hypothetical protein